MAVCVEIEHDGPRTGDIWDTLVSRVEPGCLDSRERHIFYLNLKGSCFVPKLYCNMCILFVQGQRAVNIK